MRRDLTASLIAVLITTVIFGIAYPLTTTGVAQVLFSGKADGSRVERDGETVGSTLIAQSFRDGKRADPSYFQPRPSVTGYDPSATGFNNLGPNNAELSDQFGRFLRAYLDLEGRFTPGLDRADVPVDAVTTSASGVDPHISIANARIQASRVAQVRELPIARVNELIDEHTDGRALGVLGEPGVNVLELNLSLDDEAPR